MCSYDCSLTSCPDAEDSAGNPVSKTMAAYFSTFFDIGGIVGSIAIGYLSDRLKLRGIACVLMTVLSIPAVIRNQFFSCQLLVSLCWLLVVLLRALRWRI